ncbi:MULTISPECIES: membrane protein insertion efficiency factor YidD [Paenibacillus]|jgi:putative membrane protein insertion efficiency factor|uniref:membrane protein insertion efficiency factor YidD n=1 Tax=Paenibacillus TaxID=44249 RepID=UPI0005EC6820|nr:MULTISPECIES: membrane protein insertion efficiency factor YidD [Paenibacillus]KAE8558330.1 membrane protein insertion efficiency factor YidD [Paenibacillus polymyxa]KAF6620164.1 membrane protein insertion efficiency factor YidD [Paenibacillus sp. EKM101P]KAF6623156.1 membrane protein insertion efficiency factor YidD [Paenibacillus sp. EKM102P]KAF6634287.1 membrane protein insertion efficiency factor YidD [Paenibacillus sp. EKM10P]KAF6649808.1 membrane protein insertion efficiency factor Yi
MKITTRRVVQAPIQFYRAYISPLKPATCRFYPTCSAYALEAVEVHGALRGSWLAAKRIAKCHPFHPGGVDLVPPAKKGLDQSDKDRLATHTEKGLT